MMYIWVAIDVNDQVHELRKKAEAYASEHNLISSSLTLPFHISLKISFQVADERFAEAVDDIRSFYRSLKPFHIAVNGIEQAGPIVWVTTKDNLQLTQIHQKLDELLFQKYAVEQHEYDRNYVFHTTVFMIDNKEQITKVFEKIKDAPIPKTIIADEFLIGSSVTGVPGTFQVNEKIRI